ncbi:MAG: hypothetical protein ROO76_09995 [Terriglobia bacterium]|nr:hypothetical protein [Terriglobia bacterium]
MMLLDLIAGWQEKAKIIAPPEGSQILPARGGLPGPAFFPEGFGLQNPARNAPWPEMMAIGHNFGCENYRNEIDTTGREDNKATWRNLRRLLADAEQSIESCYMTNWFVGLQPGDRQVGEFLEEPNSDYESECNQLLLEQIRTLKPHVILLLGLSVVGRTSRIMPALEAWADAPNWTAVDMSDIGSFAYGVDVPGAGVRSNVVALLHPSFAPANQRHRRTVFPVEKPEVEMIKCATTKISGVVRQ